MAIDRTKGGRASKDELDATTSPGPLAMDDGDRGDGEEVRGVGSKYSATLRERMNKSMNRNAGPDRPSANNSTIPVLMQGVRKTGKVG